MDNIVTTVGCRNITTADIENVAKKGTSLHGYLCNLEKERICEWADPFVNNRYAHLNKGKGFGVVYEILKDAGIKDEFISYDDVRDKVIWNYKGIDKQCADAPYFFLKRKHPVLVLNRPVYDGRGFWVDSFEKKDLIDLLKSLPDVYAKWDAENQVISRIFEKNEKLRKIAETSIQILVDNELKGKGYDYSIVVGRTRSVLTVNMKKQRKLEISLTNRGFHKAIGHLCEIIDQITGVSDGIKVNFKITHSKEQVKA